jgi:hypothetical protein
VDLETSDKFCPVCKNKNAMTASVCSHCGALLEENLTNRVAATTNVDGQSNISAEDIGSFIDTALIPEGGLGIYVAGSFKPYYLRPDSDLIIGRKLEATSESILDLSDFDAFNMGLSRRHAMLRRTESGYEVTDLFSTNGTWLNAERLIPNKPYQFASGSQLRIGRLRLFIMYQTVLNTGKK